LSIESIISSIFLNQNLTEYKSRRNRWVPITGTDSATILRDVLGEKEFVDNLASGKIKHADFSRVSLLLTQRIRDIQVSREKRREEIFTALKKFKVFKNIEAKNDKDIFFFQNTESGLILDNINTMAFTFNDTVVDKDALADFKLKAPTVRLFFDPNLPYGLQDIGEEYLGFNKYRRIDWDKVEDEPLGQHFVDLMEHLFPDESDRRRTCSWIYFAETLKIFFALVLCGAKGAGKSTLIEIIKNMYGIEQVRILARSFWEGKFNGELEHAKLCIGEETILRGLQSKSKFKESMNDFITIEKKGQDPKSNIPSYCNFILTTNDAYTIEVEPDERRLFIPSINKERIKTPIVAAIMKDIKRLPALKAFRKYLKENSTEDFDIFHPDKNTDTFWEMVRQSSAEHYDFVLNELEKSPEIEHDYRTLKKKYEVKNTKGGRRFPSKLDLKRFFEHFTPNNRQYVAVDRAGLSYKLAPKDKT